MLWAQPQWITSRLKRLSVGCHPKVIQHCCRVTGLMPVLIQLRQGINYRATYPTTMSGHRGARLSEFTPPAPTESRPPLRTPINPTTTVFTLSTQTLARLTCSSLPQSLVLAWLADYFHIYHLCNSWPSLLWHLRIWWGVACTSFNTRRNEFLPIKCQHYFPSCNMLTN